VSNGAAPPPSFVLPFHDPSRRRRLVKVAAWLGAVAVALVVLDLLGVDVGGWLDSLRDTLTRISFGYLLAGCALQTIQTTLAAAGWYFILRSGFPHRFPTYLQVLAAYAAGGALDSFVPADIGTFVMLLMFVAIIPGATFAGVFGGVVVQKIFFTVIAALVYLYLLLSMPASFKPQLGFLLDHPVLVAAIAGGGALLVVVLVRAFWRRLHGLWQQAKRGGAILARPAAYAMQVVLPSAAAWLARLGVIAVFLAAYSIPVTFHTVMSVVGGKSVAGIVSLTPGGIGVNQAVDVAALKDVTDASTATAYSVGQQLAMTAWNIAFALVLVVWAFGWTSGKLLVERAYDGAKTKVAEQKTQHRAARSRSSI
jgi:uncharacterized membrane protein YbhN (UPF0104 family)